MNKICRNCGKYGHIYKHCTKPISSYGIILFDKDSRKYLLIQRKNSIAFTEFIFGKYQIDDYNYIANMFARMANDEIRLIKTKPKYSVLWNKIYNSKYNKYTEHKYNKFLICFSEYIDKIPLSEYNECEWEFPKGRRNNNETDIECACREFYEETNVNISNINITINKFYERYVSSNLNTYLHVYYLAYLKNKNLVLNKTPCSEISKIKWFSYEDAINIIRNYSIEKKRVLQNIEKYLKQIYIKNNTNINYAEKTDQRAENDIKDFIR